MILVLLSTMLSVITLTKLRSKAFALLSAQCTMLVYPNCTVLPVFKGLKRERYDLIVIRTINMFLTCAYFWCNNSFATETVLGNQGPILVLEPKKISKPKLFFSIFFQIFSCFLLLREINVFQFWNWTQILINNLKFLNI